MILNKHREEEAAAAEDEDTGAQVGLIVMLEEVAVTTGDEDAILDLLTNIIWACSRKKHRWPIKFNLRMMMVIRRYLVSLSVLKLL
uniref:Uncharacterized protein n=1 Tax=Helianthus annuus TaxID=4232 RepID=A0A251TYF7_HELAN